MLIEHLNKEFHPSHPVHEMILYHLKPGGKMLRGQLALAEAKELGIDHEQALKWALACECLHNATLIHDDIQDNDPIRRGQPSLWKKFGIAQAINAGDYLIFRALKLTSQLNSPLLTEVLAEVSEYLVQGQALELLELKSNNGNYWNSYLQMTRLKTGTLLLLPVYGINVLITDKKEFSQKDLWMNLGTAYQILDDIRDYLGLKQTGQNQKDFQEKRINALVAWISQSPGHREKIERYLSAPQNSSCLSESAQNLCRIIEEENIIDFLSDFCNQKINKFKLQTAESTQNVILKYVHSAIQKGELNHERSL